MYEPISYRFQDKWRFQSKIVNFSHPRVFNAPTEGIPWTWITAQGVKKLVVGRLPQYAPAPCKLTFDLLTFKVVPESRVTWATSVQILVFLSLSVLNLGPMYATDTRQTDVRRASLLNAPAMGAGA